MEISGHEIRIVKVGPERIVDAEPLWKALHIYQQDIDSDLPFRSLDQSWTLGRLRHEKWLREIGSFMGSGSAGEDMMAQEIPQSSCSGQASRSYASQDHPPGLTHYPFMLFAEYIDKPVGYAIIHHRQEESAMWQVPDRVAILEILSVLPEARNMGIGTALVNAVCEELRLSNISELALNVLYTNTDALRFYERCGMTPKLIEMHKSIPEKQLEE